MNVTTLGRCARVCSLWNELTRDHTLWRALCIRDSYISASLPRIPDWSKSWIELYKFHYECKINIFALGEVKDGRGTFTWSNGAMYEGEWKNDKEHGRGKKVWIDGATFEGEWEEGKFSGTGTHTWASGSQYKGTWSKHKRNGIGRNVWPQKDVYEGEWLEDQKSGFGTYTWADGRVYSGFWKNDKRCGKGTFVWSPMGFKYVGEWLNDRGHGHGIFFWGDGHFYEGQWVNGRRCGSGKYHIPDGKIYAQEWTEEREFNADNRGDLSQETTNGTVESPKRKVLEDGTSGQGFSNAIMGLELTVSPRVVKRRR